MNTIIFTLMFLLIVGVLGCFLLWLVLMIDSMARGHDLPTSQRATKALFKIIVDHGTAKNFYDLGCARGGLAIRAKKKFPGLTVYAIDNDPLRVLFAKARALVFGQNIIFSREDIFKVNLSDADIVYAYLWYDMMPLLEKKLQKELKQGALVITNTSNFPTWEPIQKIVTYYKISKTPNFETLFVYKKT